MAQMKSTAPRIRRAAAAGSVGVKPRTPVAPPETALKPGGKSRTPGRPKPANPAAVREIFTRFRAANPHPKGDLEFSNPFTLLIAVVLSAQTTDAGVNKATRDLFPIADTPQKMLALGEANLRDRFKPLGFFNTKARNVVALCEQLIAKHCGQVPRNREELEALPGVGRKTANVVLNVAFGQPTIAVDTHVFRVSNRIPLAIGATPLDVELGLEKIIPAEFKTHAHHWLILHGRYTCKARRPECERCIIPDLCRSPEKRV
ncbi:MAG: endonuclease [Methylobacteriaceae bacterium]|nr:endonuclease [Methylobacteriaceae bacterium]